MWAKWNDLVKLADIIKAKVFPEIDFSLNFILLDLDLTK